MYMAMIDIDNKVDILDWGNFIVEVSEDEVHRIENDDLKFLNGRKALMTTGSNKFTNTNVPDDLYQ